MDEIGDQRRQPFINFRILYLVTQMVGCTLIILMGSWISLYLGGVGWSDPKYEFNWHPLLMTIGMIYLYGNSILLYRGVRYARKKNLKISHATVFGIVMVLAICALIAVFDSHNYANPPIPNLYSLHSWVGLSAIILFGCQWIAGFFSFMYPEIRGSLKAAYMPIHIYFGMMGYLLAAGAALLGLSEKAFFSIKNISDLPHEGVLVNCIGALIIIFTGLLGYLVTKGEYKRAPLPEDAILLTGNDD